ncbi:hypothetical protein [Streptomyces rubradiris]|uniref:Uncharacterized protein n=1 Tax=Streptomyces rubradiris TaxID=285531 RepID=A0ABQ3R8F2_STRRR|nr:hypothetical protein [Streptomyces rubradiris]GHH23107.1 hypothetical protein GCM10018792_59430 [Streptomyces rubradiris]GHI52123.1 hypothetical protein Srubr_19690 [Streptomyces rubradiris]
MPDGMAAAAAVVVPQTLRTFAKEQRWTVMARAANLRTLRFLAAWLGVDAPLHEADVREVARFGSSWGRRRVVPFLSERGLLIPLERTDPEQAAVERLLDTIPDHLHDEVKVWVRVMRGEGRRLFSTVCFGPTGTVSSGPTFGPCG